MNRNDRRVAIALLAVGVLALVAVFLLDDSSVTTPPPADSHPAAAATYTPSSSSSSPYARPSERHVEQFPFDPNTADSTQLLRLGLTPWQVRNIYRYRSRGGIYRSKQDFARLYGLTVKDYRRLEPYIRISSDYLPASTLVGERPRQERDTLQYPVKLAEGEHIVLNTADTAQLKRVPGIGSYWAREIVRHGRWLGGYVDVSQLDEIDNFPSSAKKYFIIQQPNPQRLNINKLTLQQLRRHPYINFYQAKAIVDYRRLNGKLQSLEDLRLSRDFPPEAIERLRPYVEF